MSDWKVFLDTCGAQRAGGQVTDFGDPQGELAAANNAIRVDLGHLGLLRVGGADALNFIQGQFSSDVRQVDEVHSQLSSHCSPKGRILTLFRLFRRGDDYYLLMPAELLADSMQRLRKYVLMSKVTLADAGEELVRLGVTGTAAEALGLTLPDEVDGVVSADEVTVIRVPGETPRYVVVAPADTAMSLWGRLDGLARAVGAPVWAWQDIRAGIPSVATATVEAFVPQMVNLQQVGGVSFKKGCYPGQEVVARMQYLGKLKRRMYLAHIDTPSCPDTGTDLFSPQSESGQGAGKVVAAAAAPGGGCDVLAVIEIAQADNGEVFVTDGNGPRLQLQALPYPINTDDAKQAG